MSPGRTSSGGPRRIERRRRRGWRMPVGAVYVGRPTIWGNPFRITRSSDYHGLPGSWFLLGEDGTMHHPDQDTERSARQKAVELFSWQVLEEQGARVSVQQIRAELAGHDLVCWCPGDEPCHADFLLRVANAPAARPSAPVTTIPACSGCGQPLAYADPVARRGEGDLSLAGVPQRLRCLACGREQDSAGHPG